MRRPPADLWTALRDDDRPGVRFLLLLAVAVVVAAVGFALLVLASGLTRAIGPLAGTAVFLAALAGLCVWFVRGMR